MRRAPHSIVLVLALSGVAPGDTDVPTSPVRRTIHLATVNIAHGRGRAPEQLGHDRATFARNVDRVADVVRAHHPDVVALQEADAPSLWSGGFDHVRRIAGRAGYDHVHHGLHFEVGVGALRIAYGTAVLSRTPLTNRSSHRYRHGPLHSKGFVMADTKFDGKPLTVVSLHLHSGSSEVRRQQADEIIAQLRDRKRSLVVMGDFNCTWFDEDDALRRVVAGLKLVAHDAPNAELGTFPATAPRKRLDWILISSDLTFVSYAIWTEKISDHLAVGAVIRRRTKTRKEAVGD